MSVKQSTEDVPTHKPAEVPFYVQFKQEVRTPKNWAEFLKFAGEATTLIQKVGLVHGIFDFETGRGKWNNDAGKYVEYTNFDRLEFLFGVADGWADKSLLRTDGVHWFNDETKYLVGYDRNGNHIKRTESEQRQVLARKAFDMLVAHFFKMPEIREDHSDRENVETRWMMDFVFGPIFPIVQSFFRFEEEKRFRAGIRNLSLDVDRCSNSERQAIDFLLKLTKFLWSWKDPRVSYWGKSPEDKVRQKKEEEKILAMRTVVDGAKPWMIEVLTQLHELHLLEKWILELDDSCLATLKKISLRNELRQHLNPVSENRKVATVDEACYLGSPAGWLLKKHELMNREYKRLTKIRDAERKKRDADREIENLTKK